MVQAQGFDPQAWTDRIRHRLKDSLGVQLGLAFASIILLQASPCTCPIDGEVADASQGYGKGQKYSEGLPAVRFCHLSLGETQTRTTIRERR